MGSESRKNQVACRVSREIYDKVKALTQGENPPFESVSEYLYSLIMADLGRREMDVDMVTYNFLELLQKPEVRAEIKRLMKE